jgi:hypothetical protein
MSENMKGFKLLFILAFMLLCSFSEKSTAPVNEKAIEEKPGIKGSFSPGLITDRYIETNLDETPGDGAIGHGSAINVRDFGASGSEFETTTDTKAGSNIIVLNDIGDFQVGQQVTVSKCNPNMTDLILWPGRQYNLSPAVVDLRGYDGSLGNWTVYMLDFAGTTPATFRWSDDLGLTWKGTEIPVTGGWQKLNGGVEVKLGNRDWTKPCGISFSGRDQLISTIRKIKGNQVTLADTIPSAAKGCVVRHSDSGPLQTAFDKAAAEGKNIFIPSGRYRLTSSINLNNADGITVEGENEERTILDISSSQERQKPQEGHNTQGACIAVNGGTSVTIRNIRFQGFSGFSDSWVMNGRRFPGFGGFFGFYVRSCRAVYICGPERLLVENCHASGMSAECFYSESISRKGNEDPPHYTKSIVYRNCTIMDCARNGFNNNDYAENTAMLYCRIQDVGGCAWEGASRFVQFVGNYVRNAGFVLVGSIESRVESLDILPSGQHIVAHNTFEQQAALGGIPGGGEYGVLVRAGATPVLIKDNIFVNFNSSAIGAMGSTTFGRRGSHPPSNIIISGNAIDLTCVRDKSIPRAGINVSVDNTIVSDNQIYVRGEVDPNVKGIVLSEPERNIVVHDNIISGCAIGLQGVKQTGSIVEVIDSHTFKSDGNKWNTIPWPRRRTHLYRDCRLAWLSDGNAVAGPEIETFDSDQLVFRLTGDSELKPEARFGLYSPQGFNWNLHHNMISNCDKLVDLDVFGGPTAVFSDNILSRGEVKNVEVAVSVRGVFSLTGNRFVGFDGPNSTALLLQGDQFGKASRSVCRDNVFDQCTKPVGEGIPGVWDAAIKGGNVFGDQAEISVSESGNTSVPMSVP